MIFFPASALGIGWNWGFIDMSFFHYAKRLDGHIDTVRGIPVRILEDFLEELGYFK